MATLDLRIDYMRPAEPRKDLYTEAECYRTTVNIAFVRATAYQDDRSDPIATSVATFMLGSASGVLGSASGMLGSASGMLGSASGMLGSGSNA